MDTRHNFLMVTALSLVLILASGQVSAQNTSANVDFGAAIELADAHADNLRIAEADAAYQSALASNPGNPTVYVRYAAFKRFVGEYTEALHLLQQAEALMANGAALTPGPGYLQLGYGLTFYRGRINCDRSVAIFSEGTGTNLANATNHSHLAFAEMCRGNNDEALRHFQVSERLFGDNLNDYRGSILMLGYAHLGRQQAVMRLFDRIRGMQNVTQAAWAAAYIALGDYPQAHQHFEAAVEQPQAFGGASNVLGFISSNLFDDPVLYGPEFQALFARMKGEE